MRGGPKHLAPALSLRDPCSHPRVRGDLFVLPRDRCLAALCVLRIRSRERSLVDAESHQLIKPLLVPGVEEVGVHGGVRARRELRLATSGWDGEFDVRLEPRYGVWVAGRARRLSAVGRRDGIDHMRAVVVGEAGSVSSIGFPGIGCPVAGSLARARQSGNLTRTTNLPLEHCVGAVVDHVPLKHLHSTFLPCTVTIFSPSSSCPSPLVSKAGWGFTSTLGDLAPNR